MAMRSHFCGRIDRAMLGQTVALCGWVQHRRDLGGLVFLLLRDHEGVVQVVAEPDNADVFAQASAVRHEYCVRVEGTVRERPAGQINRELASGEVEVVAASLEVLSAAEPLPLLMSDEDGEEVRLRYRFLDLRRPRLQRNLRTRAKLTAAIRRHLDGAGFVDVETPILTRATPEGARDYLVPSRVRHGAFYALPQSPQLFKQLLIAGGIDRYYQIARCFRDEDLRADRQPEFTQLDIEMAFVDESDVRERAEGTVRAAFRDVLDVDLPPFPVMTYGEAMARYGSDKPDLRCGLELTTVDEWAAGLEFKVFSAPAADAAGRVALIKVPGAAGISRRELDELAAHAAKFGAQGLAWLKVNDPAAGLSGIQSSFAKFLDAGRLAELLALSAAGSGDLLLFAAGPALTVNTALGQVRLKVARDRGLFSAAWRPLWVVDFPMFEWDTAAGRWSALHHPFTAPAIDDPARLAAAPGEAVSRAYDMVLNGMEIGGGSIRIHRAPLQQAVFALLGIAAEEAERRFGFLLQALRYGAPPMGGIALGIDRIAALMLGEDSIRDVIAFPKTTAAACLMTGAPAPVEAPQLAELGIAVAAAEQGEGDA